MMELQDFSAIMKYRLLRYLPDLTDYCSSLSQDTKDAWFELLKDQDPQDFAEACVDFAEGRETLAAYERGSLAQRLLGASRRHRAERTRKADTQSLLRQSQQLGWDQRRRKQLDEPKQAPMGGALHAAGLAQEFSAIQSLIQEAFPFPSLANVVERMELAKQLGRKAAAKVRRGEL